MIRSELEQFEIIKIGLVNNAGLAMLGGIILWVGLSKIIAIEGNGRIVPTRLQIVLESIYKLILGMTVESIGKKVSGEYVGIVLTLFTLILIWNLLGLIPYSFTVTSQIVITLILSGGVWCGKLILGIRKHGKELLGILIPTGAPFMMIPFFVVIEIVGLIIPLISLAVRLFANMMAGHMLLKILFGFTWLMMMKGGVLWLAHYIPLGILFLLIGLEGAVALIQAYVFALLTCIYISDMNSGGH